MTKPRRVLITGGSGFIGTNLVAHHLGKGDAVLSVDIAPPRNLTHQPHWRRQDVCDRDQLLATVDGWKPDVILHFAARTDVNSNNVADYPANTIGVSNVIEAAGALEAKPFVMFASSLLVCRLGYCPEHEADYCPINAYGHSKVEGELRVRREAGQRFPWVIVRPTSIWGPWFGPPYYQFFETVRRGWYVHPKGLFVQRHYGFVLNTISQIAALLRDEGRALTFKTVYLADYEPTNVRVWADAIRRQYGAGPVRELPAAVFRLAARLGDAMKVLGIDFPMTSYRLGNLITASLFDLSPIRSVLPRLSYGLEDGVKMTCEWLAEEKGRVR